MRHLLAAAKGPKYRNKRAESVLVGRSFASRTERERGEELALMEKAGEIRNLRFQVPVPLVVNGVTVCRWIADFVYEEPAVCRYWRDEKLVPANLTADDWSIVYEDRKGFSTDVFRLKARLFEAVMGFPILVTKPEPNRKGRAR